MSRSSPVSLCCLWGGALQSIHRHPFAPYKGESQFQPWGLRRVKGQHHPAQLCRISREAAAYLCSGRPWAVRHPLAGRRMGAGVRHQGAETLQRFGAVFRAWRTPRCLPEPCIPGARSVSRLGAAAAHPHAPLPGEPRPASGSLLTSISWRAGLAAGMRSHFCLYLRAGGVRRVGRTGSIPLVPAWGVVATVVAVAVTLPSRPASRQGDAQLAPALRGRSSPGVLGATLPTLRPYRCAAAIPPAGEQQP